MYMAAKYRKICPKIWNDSKFVSMSDNGKLVFFFLLTHPHMTPLGAMRATVAGLASELGWTVKAFGDAMQEAITHGMVKANAKASCIAIPKFLKYNQPESLNVVKAWVGCIDDIPECDLKDECILSAKTQMESKSVAFGDAFGDAFGVSCAIPSAMPCAIQEQEQKQYQEQEPEHKKEKTTSDSSEDFEKFWQHFKSRNRHIEKVKTEKAWATTLKGRPGAAGHPPVEPSTLIEAANHYRMKCEMDGTEPKYIKQPATFLGPNRHWEDYKDVPKPSGNGNGRRVITRPGEYDDVFEEA